LIDPVESWNKVALSKFSGLPSWASTIKSLVSWYCAFDGLIKLSWGLINSISSLYNALNKILKEDSVPLVEYKSRDCLINCAWFKLSVNFSVWSPGNSWPFTLFKNSCKNKTLRFFTGVWNLWLSAEVSLNVSSSELLDLSREDTPVNPLWQNKSLLPSFNWYTIISSSICIIPNWSGNPSALKRSMKFWVSVISAANLDSLTVLAFSLNFK
jgi:hypothetical protein